MTSAHDRSTGLAGERGAILVAALFFVAGLAWLGSSANYPGDERYYTDAALRMIERGEWWSPVYADGSVRANKPLLAYWAVIAGFQTLGVSLVVARLPFLLAGAVLVWLSARLARTLFPKFEGVGFVCALVVASNYEIVTLACRSTPDILLVTCATASLYGAARFLSGDVSRAAAAWFWGGGALAIATKGGLGVLVLAFGTLAALLGSQARPRRALFPIPILAAASIVAAAGLVPSLLLEARPGAPSFLDDQVGARLAESFGDVVSQLGRYLLSLFRHLLPWIALAAAGAFLARDARREGRRELTFALAWCALLVVVFSCSNTHRGRYLAPAHPLLAAALAPSLLAFARHPRGERVLCVLGWSLALLLVLLGSIVARVDLAVGSGICLGGLLFVVVWRTTRGAPRALAALAVLLLCVYAVGARGGARLLNPSLMPGVAAWLDAAGHTGPRVVATVGLGEQDASLLRMNSGGRVDPVSLPRAPLEGAEADWQALVAPESKFPELEAHGYEVAWTRRAAGRPDLRRLWRVFVTRDDDLSGLFQGPAIGILRPIGTVR